ncbi:MAG: NAD(P)H-hydrate dehydratase [Candidatus Diapherotrites archaeon]|nr:NAD(P)H-hydrate dehydratase [Candidatus Diapherotrites archaeon]
MRGQHKGENGKVLIIGGSEEYVGAPALAGLAALRSGCDIVKIATPEKVAYAINTMSPDLITIKLKPDPFVGVDNIDRLKALVNDFDCVLIGNGLGTKRETRVAINKLIDDIKKPMVIDADAIKLLSGKRLSNCVITPHSKEFELFFSEEADEENVLKHSRKDFVVLLKGKTDIISDGERIYKNETGNDAMTVGGTGDILAGIVASFIAQGMPLYDAAYRAAIVNGKAGDIAFRKLGYSMIASDLLGCLPDVMREIDF